MKVNMKDTLSSSFAHIYSEVIPIRMKILIHNALHFISKVKHVLLFLFR